MCKYVCHRDWSERKYVCHCDWSECKYVCHCDWSQCTYVCHCDWSQIKGYIMVGAPLPTQYERVRQCLSEMSTRRLLLQLPCIINTTMLRVLV